MARYRNKKPTIRDLQEDIGICIRRILKVEEHITEVITPALSQTASLLENFIQYTGNIDDFVKYMEEKESEYEKKIKNKGSEKRPQKQTARSRTAKTGSKNVKRIGPRSPQQGQGRSTA